MGDTVILVRCIEYSSAVATLTELLQNELRGTRVIAVPDLINKQHDKHHSILSQFPIETLPLTREFVDQNDLPYVGARTGWLCGDYVFYRAMELDWDYAWIVEPDVRFLNGSVRFLEELAQFDQDLVATNIGKAGKKWTWFDPISSALPGASVHAMTFPLVRMSRIMAKDSLAFRKQVAAGLPEGVRTPNDESVVATAAVHYGRSTLDIKSLFPPLFKYWTTTLKLPIDDIAERESEPRIVHSAVDSAHFMRYLLLLWQQIADGNPHGKQKLESLVKHMSSTTIEKFIVEISNRRSDGDHGNLAG